MFVSGGLEVAGGTDNSMVTVRATRGREMRREEGCPPPFTAVCLSRVVLQGTATETCTSCIHDEWQGLWMGCHDRDAGTRCYADMPFLRPCLHIFLLPGLAWSVLERKDLLLCTESE